MSYCVEWNYEPIHYSDFIEEAKSWVENHHPAFRCYWQVYNVGREHKELWISWRYTSEWKLLPTIKIREE